MHGNFWLGLLLLSSAVVLGQYYPYTGYPSSEYYYPYGYGYNDFYYPWNWNNCGIYSSDWWFGNGWFGEGWSDWSTYWFDYLLWYYAGDGWMYDDRMKTWRPFSKEQACTWCMNYWIPLLGQSSADKKCPSFCTSSSTPSTVSKHD